MAPTSTQLGRGCGGDGRAGPRRVGLRRRRRRRSPAREGASGDQHLVDRHRLVGPCARRASPGPYCSVGMPPMPVSRRRSLPYGAIQRSCVRSGRRRRGAPRRHARQVAVGGEPSRGELATPPLDLDRVVAQPRDRRRDASATACSSAARACVDRLAERDPEPALGDEQVGHRRRPVAGVDGADRERMSERPARAVRGRRRVPFGVPGRAAPARSARTSRSR